MRFKKIVALSSWVMIYVKGPGIPKIEKRGGASKTWGRDPRLLLERGIGEEGRDQSFGPRVRQRNWYRSHR